MKIYLAASYGRREEMRQVAERLIHLGDTVVSRWLWTIPEEPDNGFTCPSEHSSRIAAAQDILDIEECDYFVFFTDGTLARGGRHYETGYAAALKKRLIGVGPREHIFHYAAGVEWHDDLESLLAALCAEVLAA